MYDAIGYFRINYSTKIATKFVIAKSRVAPLKPITLPRFELLGALISVKLASYLRNIFQLLRRTMYICGVIPKFVYIGSKGLLKI